MTPRERCTALLDRLGAVLVRHKRHEIWRLEVSGTNAGERAEIRHLRERIVQVAPGESNLPAIASVVGFKALEVAISSIVGRS